MQDQTNDLMKTAMHNTQSAPMRKKAAHPSGGGVKRYGWDFGTTSSDDFKRRPDNSVSPEILRRFSITHEISRICINARKRQIAQLDWDITPLKSANVKASDVTKQVETVKRYFKHIGGYKTRFRGLQDMMIEDLLVLDGVALYKERDAAGRLLWLKAVDAATIKLVVDQWGNTPEPPNTAYRQYIRGELTAEFTADAMLYDMMNPRSTTPYGLAPLESLILVVSSALRSTIFNLDYLSYQNIPEGLLEMPEGWSQGMLDEFQDAWDSLVSGNTEASSKLRVVPSGTKYAATKKPDDMAFDKFNWWLMQVTTAMFDIQPHEIGFTDTSNRATAKEQDDVTLRKGITPLAQMLKEIWDEIIQVDLGFPELEFTYKGLEDENNLLDAQAMKIRLQTGELSIDEARTNDGLEPIGIDTPYILAGTNITWVSSGILNNETNDGDNHYEVPADGGDDEVQNDGTSNNGDEQGPSQDGSYNPATDDQNGPTNIQTSDKIEDLAKDVMGSWNTMVDQELGKFQRFAIDRIKKGKKYRDFTSEVLRPELVAELNTHASKAIQASEIIKAIRAVGHLAKTTDGQDVKHNKTLKALYAAGGFVATKKVLKKGIKQQMTDTAEALAAKDKVPASTSAFLDSATPAIAKTVDQSTLSDWYKEVYNHTVNSEYAKAGADTKFDLTSNAVTKTLEDRANTVLAKSTLDETTKKTLSTIITDGTKAGKTPAQIAADIKTAAPDIADYRANMIAVTETQNIFGMAQRASFTAMGVQTKVWENYGPHPCPACEENEGAGAIPMDQSFPSGDDWTPGHPLCECACGTSDFNLSDDVAANLWDGS